RNCFLCSVLKPAVYADPILRVCHFLEILLEGQNSYQDPMTRCPDVPMIRSFPLRCLKCGQNLRFAFRMAERTQRICRHIFDRRKLRPAIADAHMMGGRAHVDAFGLSVLHHVLGYLPDQKLLQLETLGPATHQAWHFADADNVSPRLVNNVHPAEEGKKMVRAKREEGNTIR